MIALNFLTYFVAILLVIWLTVGVCNLLLNRKFKWMHFHFSKKNYYSFMVGLFLALVISAFLTKTWENIYLFAVFAVMGVIGELIFSIWWRTFFREKFWGYREEYFFNNYSSFLNFVPWGIGGIIYINVYNLLISNYLTSDILSYSTCMRIFLLFGIGVLGQILTFRYSLRNKISTTKFTSVSFWNYLFFISPIISIAVYLTIITGSALLSLLLLFGLVGALTEYSFGKIVELIISKRLWKYNFASVDNGHFTPLSIPAFSLSGLYFLIVASFMLRLF